MISRAENSSARPWVIYAVTVGALRSLSWSKFPQENATDRGGGCGRFVADRGLSCLPTGRRFELTEDRLESMRD
jgi:hypothetical protein